MDKRDAMVLLLLGLAAGAVATLALTDALWQLRRARVDELRARRAAYEAELQWLERVDALALGNTLASA